MHKRRQAHGIVFFQRAQNRTVALRKIEPKDKGFYSLADLDALDIEKRCDPMDLRIKVPYPDRAMVRCPLIVPLLHEASGAD